MDGQPEELFVPRVRRCRSDPRYTPPPSMLIANSSFQASCIGSSQNIGFASARPRSQAHRAAPITCAATVVSAAGSPDLPRYSFHEQFFRPVIMCVVVSDKILKQYRRARWAGRTFFGANIAEGLGTRKRRRVVLHIVRCSTMRPTPRPRSSEQSGLRAAMVIYGTRGVRSQKASNSPECPTGQTWSV